jgi:hypothetical protein
MCSCEMMLDVYVTEETIVMNKRSIIGEFVLATLQRSCVKIRTPLVTPPDQKKK